MARYDLDRAGVAAAVERAAPGAPGYRVQQVWDGLYRQLQGPEQLTSLPVALRHAIGAELAPALAPAGAWDADGGATRKWVWRLADGAVIETVRMRAPGRTTVCVSTQAGCAMACGFCATGQAGFTRHLTIGEIVEQVARGGREVTHVVFMGMGEPLANYDATWGAVHRLHDDVGLSARRLTISTVGIVPGIRRLARADLPVNLAVSLHAAHDALRDELVPINRRYPLAVLAEACQEYVTTTHRRLSLEWALMAGVNDGVVDAARLAGFAQPLGAHVNLIPLNPTPGFGVPGSSPEAVRAFRDALGGHGVNVTVRRPRGRDIAAACGQLAGTVGPEDGAPSPTCHT
jgi:23S rRNA (adenine2503-C2)-methyltransferase